MIEIASELGAIVGHEHVLTDPELTRTYEVDWTRRFQGRTPAVVRPGSTAEVAKVLATCHRHGVAVVPQGGNTGLVGGGVPLGDEVVLSLTRLRELESVDCIAGQVTAEAGVTLAELRRHVAFDDFDFGVDLASRDSATIGGMIATNAGGVRMIRYGPMRAQVTGIEAVLADGTVVSHLQGLLRDNTGYDLTGLLTGSEGTLAVITRARLRLVPWFEERVAALCAFDSMEEVAEAAMAIRRQVSCLEAAEVFFAEGLELVCQQLALRSPFSTSYPVYLLIECADHDDPTDQLAEVVAGLGTAIRQVAVATEPVPRSELWRLREAHTEAISAIGIPHKLDVSLPPPALADFVPCVHDLVAGLAPGARCYLFGHIGDGNLHVNVLGLPEAGQANESSRKSDEVDGAVFALVAGLGGSISAEHGIGTAKRQWLHLSRSPSEISLFRSIKSALDGRGILNPNVLLPPPAPVPAPP